MAADQSGVKRFLCSDLVVLNIDGRQQFVNLEEIWSTGAVLESEEAIACAATGELRAWAAALNVAIDKVEKHEFGWRVEIRFTGAEWTPQLFTPAHLTDPECLAPKVRTQAGSTGPEKTGQNEP